MNEETLTLNIESAKNCLDYIKSVWGDEEKTKIITDKMREDESLSKYHCQIDAFRDDIVGIMNFLEITTSINIEKVTIPERYKNIYSVVRFAYLADNPVILKRLINDIIDFLNSDD